MNSPLPIYHSPRKPVAKSHAAKPCCSITLLDRVLLLIENGCNEAADQLASVELLFNATSPELWLVAGLARFQKGNLRTAKSAFQMSAWLNDNPLAREMLEVIGG